MKKQVIAIHGGDAFPTYEEYLNFLRNFEIDFDNLSIKGWKTNLGEALGDGYEIILPRMPNSTNAKYVEWKIWFEKYFSIIKDDVILIGHSLGASFLAKYLSEEDFPKKIKATFLVAGPYNKDEERDLVEFVPPGNLENFTEQGGKIFLYHSKDDPIVHFQELEKYQDRLPTAQTRIFEDREHFSQEELPEIVKDIKALE